MQSTAVVQEAKTILNSLDSFSEPKDIESQINELLLKATNPTLPILDRLVATATLAGLNIVDNRRKGNYWTK